MTNRRVLFSAVMAAGMVVGTAPSFAAAVFRMNATAPGEADPDKAIDYIGSVLAFNLYDGLALRRAGRPRAERDASRASCCDIVERRRRRLRLYSPARRQISFRQCADRRRRGFLLPALMALGKGSAPLFADHVASVAALDARTVKFTLSATFAPFVGALTRLPILDSKSVMGHKAEGKFGDFGDYGEAYLSDHDAGSGAYEILSHVPESETYLGKFADYFLGVPASARDKVRFRYGLQPSTVRELVASGELDMTSQWLPPEVVRALVEGGGVHLLADRGSAILFLQMNTNRPPLDDLNCRLALTYAFDYATAIKLAQITDNVSAATPANGPLGRGVFGYNPSLPPFAQDLGKAKESLSRCKYKAPDERAIGVAWIAEAPAEERQALLMKGDFDALGFQTTIRGTPLALYQQQVTKAQTTSALSVFYVIGATPDPDSILLQHVEFESAADLGIRVAPHRRRSRQASGGGARRNGRRKEEGDL